MRPVRWDPSYSVGVRELDEQHQHLLGVYNRLVTALAAGQADEAAYPALQELVDYLDRHFSAEEKYMRQYGFPGYEAHKAEHEQFRDEVIRFLNAINEEEPMVGVKISNFVSAWLAGHIFSVESSDRGYREFFQKCGLK